MAKKMKKIDLSCASPASTAICSSLDQRSMIKTSTKSLHRLNSYLGDHYKTLTNNNNNNSSYYSASPKAPCISELPFTPRPSSFSAYRDKARKLAPSSFSYGVNHSDVLMSRRRRSSADIADIKRHTTTTTTNNNINNIKKNKHIYGGDSSRYLLGESRYLDSLSGNEYTKNAYNNNNNTTTTSSSSPVYGRCEGAARKSTSGMERRRFGTMLDAEKEKIRKHFSLIDVGDDQSKHINNNNTTTTTTTTCVDARLSQSQRQMQRSVASHSPSTYANDSLVHVPNKPPSPHQVVVLRVSLHCKGCENKLRKHLSKLPGVASYNIDMETKKVTVTGNVTPYEMLTSISKVKNAQFWPSQASSTSTSSSSSTSSTIDLN